MLNYKICNLFENSTGYSMPAQMWKTNEKWQFCDKKKIVDVTSFDESIETLSQNKIVKTDIEDNANEVSILPDL